MNTRLLLAGIPDRDPSARMFRGTIGLSQRVILIPEHRPFDSAFLAYSAQLLPHMTVLLLVASLEFLP